MATANDSGIDAYMLSFFSSLQALEDQQEKHRRAAKDESLSESERAEAAAAFLDMTRQIARLRDAHEAFMRTFTGTGVTAPSDAVIQRSKELAAGLAAQLVKNLTAVAVLGIVAQFVNAWAGLSGAAPADAGTAVAHTASAAAATPELPPTALNLTFLKAHAKKTKKTKNAKKAKKAKA